MMGRLLEDARTCWAGRPRAATGKTRDYWARPMPDPERLVAGTTPLDGVLDRLWIEGRVCWGLVVGAHPELSEPGATDRGAFLVYSFDPLVDREPAILGPTVDALHELAGLDQLLSFEELKIQLMLSGRRGEWGYEVPPAISGGVVVWMATGVVWRAHLPGGRLRDSLVPIVAAPGVVDESLVLPDRWWPEELKRRWLDDDEGPDPEA